MNTSSLFEYILGGGLVSLFVAVLTLKSQVRKAHAETSKFELQNSEQATEILMDNIVVPLKSELHETRNELTLLRKALQEASHCPYYLDCPVLSRLRSPAENCMVLRHGNGDGKGPCAAPCDSGD